MFDSIQKEATELADQRNKEIFELLLQKAYFKIKKIEEIKHLCKNLKRFSGCDYCKVYDSLILLNSRRNVLINSRYGNYKSIKKITRWTYYLIKGFSALLLLEPCLECNNCRSDLLLYSHFESDRLAFVNKCIMVLNTQLQEEEEGTAWYMTPYHEKPSNWQTLEITKYLLFYYGQLLTVTTVS